MTTNPQASASKSTNPAAIGAASIIIATVTLIVALVLGFGLPSASAQQPQVENAGLNHLDTSHQYDVEPQGPTLSLDSREVNQGALDSIVAPDICRALLRAFNGADDVFSRELARLQYRDHGCEHYVGFPPL